MWDFERKNPISLWMTTRKKSNGIWKVTFKSRWLKKLSVSFLVSMKLVELLSGFYFVFFLILSGDQSQCVTAIFAVKCVSFFISFFHSIFVSYSVLNVFLFSLRVCVCVSFFIRSLLCRLFQVFVVIISYSNKSTNMQCARCICSPVEWLKKDIVKENRHSTFGYGFRYVVALGVGLSDVTFASLGITCRMPISRISFDVSSLWPQNVPQSALLHCTSLILGECVCGSMWECIRTDTFARVKCGRYSLATEKQSDFCFAL